MTREIKRLLMAVPIASKLAAGKVYAGHTKRSADDHSFTPGFFDAGGNEWAVACWAVGKDTMAQFDSLIAAYPAAKVVSWLDGDGSPEQELAKLGLSRPVPPMGGGGGIKIDEALEIKLSASTAIADTTDDKI